MTYPIHFRKKALKEAERNAVVVTAKKYTLSTRSINQWKKCLEPKKTRKLIEHKVSKEALLKDVSDFPDAYQYERAERLGVSKTCLHNLLKRYHISNKRLHHPM